MSKSVELHHPHEEWSLVLEKEEETCRATLDMVTVPSFQAIVTAISQAAFWLYATKENQLMRRRHEELTVEQIISEIQAQLHETETVCIGVVGRSGSGKTTMVRRVIEQLAKDDLSVANLSIDDYNRGKTELMRLSGDAGWDNWDSPLVYNTAAAAYDIQSLVAGDTIRRRRYNFEMSEPDYPQADEVIKPAKVIVIEGIMANSSDLTPLLDVLYEVTTPLATCIGRRVLRDLQSGRAKSMGGSPEDVLRYQIEIAEPEYRRRLQ